MRIVRQPAEFIAGLGYLEQVSSALPAGIFMVRPEQFSIADESSVDNVYLDTRSDVDPERALAQFDALVELIGSTGVAVKVFQGHRDQPDGIFPNNVFGTAEGRFIVGHMLHPGRQAEATHAGIREWLGHRTVIDLSVSDCVAELTGPLIIDRARRIGFCGMSTRVDEAGLLAMHHAFDLACTFAFDLVPTEYHTNVVMSVLASRACVLHPDAFTDAAVAEAIGLAFPGRCLHLSAAEKNAFAANCIALTDSDLFFSQTALDALRPTTRATLESWNFTLHSTPLDEIEKAGGSLRCMVAEIF